MPNENLLSAARLMRYSKPIKAAAMLSRIDATKCDMEIAGIRRPLPDSAWALGIVAVAREAWGPVPPPKKGIPAPFDGRGMVLLEPTGGTEDIAAWKNAGGTYVMLNLGFTQGGNWDVQRARARTLGMEVVPWKRVRNASDSRHVEDTASLWLSKASAHNLEAEAVSSYTPAQLAASVSGYAARTRAVITEPWAQNSAGWEALKTWVGMPEAFMNANPKYTPAVCCEHLRNEGIPRCVPMFGWGVWADAPHEVMPGDYLNAWNGPYSVYFGDGREHEFGDWE
jgi:hypothetical protein